MRTIKLCAAPRTPAASTAAGRHTTLLEAIRRSAIEIERTGRVRRPLALPARHGATAFA